MSESQTAQEIKYQTGLENGTESYLILSCHSPSKLLNFSISQLPSPPQIQLEKFMGS